MTAVTDDEARLRRIRYRAWHRGFREADLILGPFVDRHLTALDAGQLDRLETLFDQPDQDLYDWIIGRRPVPPEHDTDVFGLLRSFRYSAHDARSSHGA